MPSVSVVIPEYKHWELVHSLLFDIYQFNRDVLEVIVVDDCSMDEDVLNGFKWWANGNMLPVKWIELKENVGFLRASNRGVAEASGDIILLVSTDVSIKRPILDEVRQKLGRGKVIIGGRLLSNATGWNDFKGKICPYLEGYLLGFTKEAWNEIGGFDERYTHQDFEDVDLSTTAISKGYSLVELENSQIVHLGAATLGYTPEREMNTKENREIFRQKWNLEYV